MLDRRERESLDRHITGNGGEDQFKSESTAEYIAHEGHLLNHLEQHNGATVVVLFSRRGDKLRSGGLLIPRRTHSNSQYIPVKPSLVVDMAARGILTEVSSGRLHQKVYRLKGKTA